MTDIFISYAAEDLVRAGKLAGALEGCGWSVWWDRKIVAGQTFDQVIERELETAKNIVVLWSKDSIRSEWVKNEAAVGAERGVLVPVLIDRVKLPLEFRRRQAADLVDWDGSSSHDGFQVLCNALSAERAPAAAPLPAPATRPGLLSRRHLWIWSVLAPIVVALGVGAYWAFTPTTQQTTPEEATEQRIPEEATEQPVPEGATQQRSPEQAAERAGPADAIAGTYYGDVVSDARGSSRSDVTVYIAKLSERRVRVTSDYDRLGTLETDVSRVVDTIQNVGSDAALLLELSMSPPRLSYNPDGTVAYSGEKQ